MEEKYYDLQQKWSGGLRILVWAIIDCNGPIKLIFVEGKLNSEGLLKYPKSVLRCFQRDKTK